MLKIWGSSFEKVKGAEKFEDLIRACGIDDIFEINEVLTEFKKRQGWIRDLTMEGIEPNPGPTWDQLVDAITKKFKAEMPPDVGAALFKIQEDIVKLNPDSMFVDTKDALEYLNGPGYQKYSQKLVDLVKETIVEIHPGLQGWKRDLTLEGIEPNPGPITWGDIEKLVKDRIGGDFNPEVHQQVLDELKNDVRAHCQLNPVAIINSDHVLKYLNEKEPSHPFSDLIQEVISTLTKSEVVKFSEEDIATSRPMVEVYNLPFTNRTSILVQLCEIFIANYTAARSPTASTKGYKFCLPLADHMFGSGKTYLAAHLIHQVNLLYNCETNPLDQTDQVWIASHKSLQKLSETSGDAFRVVQKTITILIDFRFLPGGDMITVLKKELVHALAPHWQKARELVGKSVSNYTLGKLVRSASSDSGKNFLICFDEVQQIDDAKYIYTRHEKEVGNKSEEGPISSLEKFYIFWTEIHTIWQGGFVFVTGRSPQLLALGKGLEFEGRKRGWLTSPGTVTWLNFGRFTAEHIRFMYNASEKKIISPNQNVEYQQRHFKVAPAILTAFCEKLEYRSGGVGRFIGLAFEMLNKCNANLKKEDDLKILDKKYYLYVKKEAPSDLVVPGVKDKTIGPFLRMLIMGAFHIPIDPEGTYPASYFGFEDGLNHMTISEALATLHLWTARGVDNLVYINYPELLFDYLEDTNEWVEIPLYQSLYRKQAIVWSMGKAMEVLVMAVLLHQMNNRLAKPRTWDEVFIWLKGSFLEGQLAKITDRHPFPKITTIASKVTATQLKKYFEDPNAGNLQVHPNQWSLITKYWFRNVLYFAQNESGSADILIAVPRSQDDGVVKADFQVKSGSQKITRSMIGKELFKCGLSLLNENCGVKSIVLVMFGFNVARGISKDMADKGFIKYGAGTVFPYNNSTAVVPKNVEVVVVGRNLVEEFLLPTNALLFDKTPSNPLIKFEASQLDDLKEDSNAVAEDECKSEDKGKEEEKSRKKKRALPGETLVANKKEKKD